MPETDQVREKSDTDRDDKGPIQRRLDKIRSTPTGRLTLRIGVGVLGSLIVAAGIVMVPFPGPGWAVVILGLAVWAVEFSWAKRALEFTKRHVQSWTRWLGRQNWPVRILVGLATFLFVCLIVWASVRVSFGINLVTVVLNWFR
jgi:uncharacterized protein (TIGR02611 family)